MVPTGLDEAVTRLDEALRARMQESPVPGLVVALTDRSRTLWVGTYGYSDVAAQTPMTAEKLFQTGSIGKSFTSIALLQEHAAGRLNLHAPITDYLPWFRVRSTFPPITAHHLLSHTAGIASGFDFSPDSRGQVWSLRETDALWAPGERFFYSNDGYKTLGLVLKQLTGQTYAEAIKSRILDPLGMKGTHPTVTLETRKHLATGYAPFYDDRPYGPGDPMAPANWFETDTADGALAAPAEDMAIYVRMLLNRGAGGQGRILSEESFDLLTRPVIEVSQAPDRSYAYGLGIERRDGYVTVEHGGGMPGFTTQIMVDLDAGAGVVVLQNAAVIGASPSEVANLALRFLRAALTGAEVPKTTGPGGSGVVEQAELYAGQYLSEGRSFSIRPDGSGLLLSASGIDVPLLQRAPDTFYVPHPDFALFHLRFVRDGEQIVAATHGPRHYINQQFSDPPASSIPDEWTPYPGHYRAFTPWLSNFRVLARDGQLILAFAQGSELPLVWEEGSRFNLGPDFPGYIRFGPIANSQAISATLIGGEYYRVDTP